MIVFKFSNHKYLVGAIFIDIALHISGKIHMNNYFLKKISCLILN